MGIEIETVKAISNGGGWSAAARHCDTCKLVAAAVFCRADSAFLCITCDTRVHHVNSTRQHERVWVCEVCEQAPAAVTCKADAAALCITCDADIHSANPLAQRHERVPVEPFYDSAESALAKCSSSPFGFLSEFGGSAPGAALQEDFGWLIQNDFNQSTKMNMESTTVDTKSGDFIFCDFDRVIDFENQNSSFHHQQHNDSVVPVQQNKPDPFPAAINNSKEHCFDIDFCRSKLSSFNYPTQSLSQSVSSSSLDFGVVPDGNSSMSDISRPLLSSRNAAAGPSSCVSSQAVSQQQQQQQQQEQLGGMDREARVSRYREKRKNRKFEKTIRYASRKAYAESRPRIKGRFAKRTDGENGAVLYANAMTSVSGFMLDAAQYGVVPSF